MRRLHLLAFVAIVAIPIGALVWLGLRVADGDTRLRRHQFDELIADRLGDIRDRAQSAVDELERELLAALDTATASEDPQEAIRELGRTQPFVRQAFSVSGDGVLVFPSADGASREELEFLERTEPIWSRSSVLRPPPSSAKSEAEASSAERSEPRHAVDLDAYRAPGDDILALARTRNSGWLTWHWREGLHLLLWQRSGDGVVGVEVERVALLSHIVAKLPTSESPESRLVLLSSRGEPVHQWGLYHHGATEAPVASEPLGFPLDTWSLAYYAAPGQRSAFLSRGSRVSAFTGAVAVAIALLALAFILFRDVRRRLREASERVNFVTQVSHELKTPLTNIRLYAELLDHELGEEPGQSAADPRDRLSVVVAESQRLTRLINNILTFSKHKREQLTVSPEWIELDEVIAGVIEQFEPALRQRGVESSFDRGVSEPVFADADAVGQIIANLLSNVLKYATEGGVVNISSSLQEDQICIAVSDRGPGIAARDARRVFRPFVRLSDSLSEGVSGTGIGLSIASELARLHDGELELAAQNGQGCRFELRIPRKTREAEA